MPPLPDKKPTARVDPCPGPFEVIDIGTDIESEAPPVPGDPPFSRTLFLSLEKDGCEAAELRLSSHAGAHLDLPAHFLAHGRRQGDYHPAEFILPALVAEIPDADRIEPAHLSPLDLEPGSALLFKTSNSRSGLSSRPAFSPEFRPLSPEAAAILAKTGIKLVGIDYISIEPLDSDSFPVHQTLLGAGLIILEGIDLSDAAPGPYTLICPPLKMARAEGSPVRPLLIRPAG